MGRRTGVMAILNLTPDSFYSGSRFDPTDVAALVARGGAALEAGAAILDVGAESTRPGSTPVAEHTEQERLLPVLAALRRPFPSALLSVDTRRADTAERALDLGADIINDVTGGDDPKLLAVAARTGCGLILMRHRGDFASMQRLPDLENPVAHALAQLERIAVRAQSAGVAPEQIVLDPGFGFGLNLDQNFPVLAALDQFHALGFPLLVGVSRKSFLRASPTQPPEERLPASLAAATIAVLSGVHLLRVHDVPETVAAARLADHLMVPSNP